jgi:hypothetical protein
MTLPYLLSLNLASRKNQTFQNGDMEVAFYRIATAENNGPGLPFTSLSSVKMRYAKSAGQPRIKHDALKCCVKGMDAYMLDDAAMAPLAHICSGGIGRTSNPNLYDWPAMLGNQVITGLGATIHALNQLATTMNAPFTFDAKAPVPAANRFFHSWFQSLHAVRMAVIEGGHRCETAMRLFYGYDVGQEAPLQYKPGFRAISSYSTMVQPLAIRIVNPDRQHNMITQGLIKELQAYSDTIQQQRDQTVKTKYKQLWDTIYDDCMDVVMKPEYEMFQNMFLQDFVDLDFEKNKQEDIFCIFVEDIKQAVLDRYYNKEPGRTNVMHVPQGNMEHHLAKLKLVGRNYKGIQEVCAGIHNTTYPPVQHSHNPRFIQYRTCKKTDYSGTERSVGQQRTRTSPSAQNFMRRFACLQRNSSLEKDEIIYVGF